MSTLTLIDGESDGGLVVFNGCENSLFDGWDLGVTGNDDTEDITLHGDTKGQGCNIEKEEILGLLGGLTSEDGGLDSSTVRNGLIGVDRLVELTATEVLRDKRLNLRDTSGATDEDDLVYEGLIDLIVAVREELSQGENTV